MITKFNTYLIQEKTDLTSVGLPHKFIKYIYRNLPKEYKLLHKTNIQKIDYNTFKDSVQDYYSGLFLIETTTAWEFIIKGESTEVCDVIVYKKDESKIFHLNNSNLLHYKNYLRNRNCSIYYLEYEEEDIFFNLEESIKVIFNKLYKNVFDYIRTSYLKEIEKEIENTTDEKYLNILEKDKSLLLNDHKFFFHYHNDLNILIKQYIAKYDYSYLKKHYKDDYKIYKTLATRLFMNINNYINFIKNKYYEIDIDRNIQLYNKYKGLLIKPELIDKYKHLDNANNFDLI